MSLADAGGETSGMAPLAGSGEAPTDWRTKLQSWLADPETRKSLASLIKSGGQLAQDMQEAPPHMQKMIHAVMGDGGKTSPVASNNPIAPYGGDMSKFLTPQMAQSILDQHGIPYGGGQ